MEKAVYQLIRKRNNLLAFAVILTATLSSCSDPSSDIYLDYDITPYSLNYGGLPAPNIPQDNQLTVEKVDLGRMLFYETRLSADGSLSCSSCHIQEFGFSDTARFSIGVEELPGKRQAMAAFNTLWHSNEFFWDGRAHLLRDQSLLPIQDPLEMNETLENVVNKLMVDDIYQNKFIRAFGTNEITAELISLALEQFMFTIVSYDSKYDQYLRGEASLTESEDRGRELFFAEFNPYFPDVSGADCAHCHSGLNFENDLYMNNGLDTDDEFLDMGRELVTGDPADRAKFKVPTLRNIEVTYPYMHDGRFMTLEEVVDHYNDGLHLSSTLEPQLEYTYDTGLMLTEEDKADLVAFLKTLTDQTLLSNPEYSSPF